MRCLITIILVAIAFVSCSNESDLKTINNPTANLTTELESASYDVSSLDSDFYFHSRVVSFTAFRLQNLTQRTTNFCKNNVEFIKTGKIFNTNIINLIQKKSYIKHSSFIKPTHRMIGLGKLVI